MNTETDSLSQTEAARDPATPMLHGDIYDQHIDNLMQRSGRYLLAQPALLLTGSYLFCSMLGMIFVVSLFDKFDFAVVDTCNHDHTNWSSNTKEPCSKKAITLCFKA